MAFAAQRLIRGSLTLLCLALLSHACAPAKPAQEVGQTPQARCEQGDTKACEQRCIAGDSPRCAEVARPLLDSTQDADIAHALQLLETGCTTEDVGSCQLLGELAVSSKIKHRDPTDVAQDVRSACFGHHQPSCTKLAYLYLEGKGVEKDEHRANELFWSACTEGDSRPIEDSDHGFIGSETAADVLFESCDPACRKAPVSGSGEHDADVVVGWLVLGRG